MKHYHVFHVISALEKQYLFFLVQISTYIILNFFLGSFSLLKNNNNKKIEHGICATILLYEKY